MLFRAPLGAGGVLLLEWLRCLSMRLGVVTLPCACAPEIQCICVFVHQALHKHTRSLGAGLQGQDRSTEMTSYYGACLTFFRASRVALTSWPLPGNLSWPAIWVLSTEGQNVFHFNWFIGPILSPGFCLEFLSVLLSSNRYLRPGHKQTVAESLTSTSGSRRLQCQCCLLVLAPGRWPRWVCVLFCLRGGGSSSFHCSGHESR